MSSENWARQCAVKTESVIERRAVRHGRKISCPKEAQHLTCTPILGRSPKSLRA